MSNELSATESITVAPARRSFLRAVVTSLLGNTAVQGLFALSSIVVSRMLLPEGRGELATLITYSELLSYVTIFGIHQATSHAIARRPEATGQITKEACVLTFVLSGLASLLGAAFGPYFLPADKQFLAPLLRVFMVYVLLYNLNWVLNSAAQGGFRFGWYNICRVLVPTTYLLGVAGVWFFHVADVQTVSWCRLLSLLLVITVQVYGLRFVLREGRSTVQDYSRLLRHGLKLHPPHVADSIQVCLDPLLVVLLLPIEDVGLYAAAISVARIQLGMGLAYTDALFVKVSEQTDHASGVRVLLGLIRRAQFYLILTTVGVMLATPWVIYILFGRAFAPAIPAALVLELATCVAALAMVIDQGMRSLGHASICTLGYLVGISVVATGGCLFVKSGGIVAMSEIKLVAAILVLLVQVSFLSFLEKIPLRQFWGLRLEMVTEGIAIFKARFGRSAVEEVQASPFTRFGSAESGAPDAGG
ncbi:MAG TPA: oligosaccharide flippase family protein [Pirellulales bacterium]|nr:oligosaccharide flippase family protein [Pirellulales bacterium]